MALVVRQGHSRDWIAANARAYPRMRLYVGEDDGGIRGYVLWSEKSGFRPDAVLELDQIAVAQPYRKRGIGEALIVQSLPLYSADEVLMVARAPLLHRP